MQTDGGGWPLTKRLALPGNSWNGWASWGCGTLGKYQEHVLLDEAAQDSGAGVVGEVAQA